MSREIWTLRGLKFVSGMKHDVSACQHVGRSKRNEPQSCIRQQSTAHDVLLSILGFKLTSSQLVLHSKRACVSRNPGYRATGLRLLLVPPRYAAIPH